MGSFENRVRFAIEVAKSVRAAVGPFFPIEFRIAQAIPFKFDMYRLAGTYQRLAEEAGVTIRLNTEVTPELVAQGNPCRSLPWASTPHGTSELPQSR